MRTIGMFQLDQMKFVTYEFQGEWRRTFGQPERNFAMMVHGESGNGKTDFCVKLAKYMAQFAVVLYLSAEEGISSTIQTAFRRNSMIDVKGRVILAEKATFDELMDYLKKRNKPGVVILDSLDYMRLTTEQYKLLRERYPKIAVVVVAWSKGELPKSQYAKDIEYMADIKVRVHRYVAHPRSRYGGNEPFIIWADKAPIKAPSDLFNQNAPDSYEPTEEEQPAQEATGALVSENSLETV